MRGGALVAASFVLSVVAIGFVHEEIRWVESIVVLALSVGVTGAVRTSWSDLPRFVTLWLDGGVLTVAVLVGAASSPLADGWATLVYRSSSVGGLLSAAALLGVLVGGLVYTHRRLESEVRATENRLITAERSALESRLAALSAQINPHFLFNTLNTLAEVVHEDEDEADDLIQDLALMMRYALEKTSTQVTLAEELAVVEKMFRIERARLGSRLRASMKIDQTLTHLTVPGFSLQPLVENAIQHTVATRREGGQVEVTLERVDGAPVLAVVDGGPGIPSNVQAALGDDVVGNAHGGGLKNALERFSLTHPHVAQAIDSGENGTIIRFSWPVEVA